MGINYCQQLARITDKLTEVQLKVFDCQRDPTNNAELLQLKKLVNDLHSRARELQVELPEPELQILPFRRKKVIWF